MNIIFLGLLCLLPALLSAQESTPLVHWDFERVENRNLLDKFGNLSDTIEGNFEFAEGILGQGLRFDGFTTCVRREGSKKTLGQEFTIEAWVAPGSYPWNWCPVLSTASAETKGFRMLMGPLGQASFECAIGEQWIGCTSEEEAVTLREWTQIIGVLRSGGKMEIYVNGKLAGSNQVNAELIHPRSGICIGMVTSAEKPSDIHRTWGTVASYYGIDGIMDEIKIYNKALSGQEVWQNFDNYNIPVADIPARRLPVIKNHPSRFGAYYTKLKYYPGWDNLWPVGEDPDIVVCFDQSPVKLIFWRGIRYGASWVTENGNWMTDQSVEAWEHGANDREGCFEHMQDRHCRFSHVRIIENTDARIVVHWRYAPTSASLNTWRPDPKTGWECWIDEYYYIYPDASAIRKVSWKKGSLGYPRQFQESLPLLAPGMVVSDLLEKEYALVADYDNSMDKSSYLEDPENSPYGASATKPYTIQQYQFKSENKPYILFEPGNEMWLRNAGLGAYDKVQGCNHFPVGQARCDGRTSRISDRPSSFNGFPISDPPVNEYGDRNYWCGVYGMNEMDIHELSDFGRSWAYAPALLVQTPATESKGYDRSQRCYQLRNKDGDPGKIEFMLEGSQESPIHNPAFYIKNWNAEKVRVLIDGKEIKNARTGTDHTLEGRDLVVFLNLESRSKLNITFSPE
ncbi:MAG TPA: LamG domain-containing protein [Bacteroides sp.]|nr:LamG domain-containing protein [Bacteroides sp.]